MIFFRSDSRYDFWEYLIGIDGAPVDHNILAGEIGVRFGAEEGNNLTELLRRSGAPQRNGGFGRGSYFICSAFLFFCDPENGFVTGQTLYVCGGGSVGAMSL